MQLEKAKVSDAIAESQRNGGKLVHILTHSTKEYISACAQLDATGALVHMAHNETKFRGHGWSVLVVRGE